MTLPVVRHHPARSVALLITALLLAGLWLDLGVLRLQHAGETWGAAFLIAVLGFAVTEAVVMHVELGRNTHSVSLAEMTLTVSLFFVPLGQVTAARLLGGGAVLLLVRHQRPMKLLFNLALWVLDTGVAILVFRELHGSLDNGIVGLVVPAILAAVSAALVDSVAVNAVITATSRELQPTRALRFVETCLLGSLGCATAGLVTVAAMTYSGWLLVPVSLVVALYLVGFQHLSILRAAHTSVNVMYEFAGELSRTSQTDQVVGIVLRRCAELLRAENAALYLDQDSRFTMTVRGDSGLAHTERVDSRDIPALLHHVMGQSDPIVLRSSSRDAMGQRFLEEYGAKDAVLAPVSGDGGLTGVLVLWDRLGEVNTFGKDDGMLLQTLVSHAVTALSNSRLVEKLDYDSLHDSLTGLANRAMFQDHLMRALKRTGEGHAVLLMDLDRFKEVNDTLGHHHGDLLLQEITARLSQQMREVDLLARLGGDEFAVLLHGIDEAAAVSTAERLHAALAEPMMLLGVEMEVGASIGVVHVPAGRTAQEQEAALLLQRADVAMYAAKKHYTGVHLYRDELDGYSPRRLTLASGLRAGIESGQLSLRYQPQLRLADGAIVGVEALVRWEHPTYGTVAPDDFISIAEQTGQIRDLTRWVLDRALADCVSWDPGMGVSVNLSVRNLMEPDLVDAVTWLLQRHGVAAERLTLEITESHLMSDPARTAEVLYELSALGVKLSVDDFGTGYSSLAYLKQLPVSAVKVDKSFVKDLVLDAEDAAIVEAIIQLAHTLRLNVVAEGVEDEATQRRLAEMGCDQMQGYHLARPMRVEELSAWLGLARLADRRVPAPRADAPSALSPSAVEGRVHHLAGPI